MATNNNFKVYSPTRTSYKQSSYNTNKLKSYQELLQEEEARQENDKEVQLYLDNLKKYQTYLEEEAKYRPILDKIDQEEKEAEEKKKNTPAFERIGTTVQDILGNIGGGLAGGLDDIRAGYKNFSLWGTDILSDTKQAIKGETPFKNIFTSQSEDVNKYGLPDFNAANHIDLGIIESEKLKELEQEALEWANKSDTSYFKDLSPKGQEIAYGVMSGIGEMLPSIAVTVVTGGAGAGLAVTGAKAFGGASEQALQEGATMNEAMSYGILNAGVEIATEKLVGGAVGKFTGAGKGILDTTIKKVSSKKIVQVGLNILGEGAEEAIAEALDPIMKLVYDEDALKGFGTKEYQAEYWENIVTSAVIGTLTSAVFEGADVVINGKYASERKITQEYEKVLETEQALIKDSLLTPELEQQFNKTKMELEAKLQLKLGAKDPNKQMQIISKIGDNQMLKNYNPFDATTEITQTKPIQVEKTETQEVETKVDFTEEQRQQELDRANKLHETFKKVNPNVGTLVFDRDLDSNINGYYNPKTKTIHINPNVKNAYAQVLTHELTHSLEGTDTYNNLQKYTLDYLRRTNEYDSIRNELEPLYKAKGLLDGMNKTEIDNYMNQEIMSKFSERLFNNQESINELVNENRTLARRIMSWVKEKLGLLTGKLSKEELELRKELRKIEDLYKKALSEPKQTKELTTLRDSYDKKIKNKKKYSLNSNDIELSKDSAFKQTTINATESYFNQEAQDILKTDGLTYEVSTNKETVTKAREELKGKRLETQIEKTLLDLQKVFKATKDNEVLVAKATLLMQEANKKGLNAQVNDLATTVSATLTQMGKATQAASIIQRLSPDGKLIAYRKNTELYNEKMKSERPNYQNKKGFKLVVSERISKWLSQDLDVIKRNATLTFMRNNQDVKLTKEQTNRLNALTTTSENYTSNVVKVFENALPNDLELAKQLGETYANGVLEQEKSLIERYENSAVIVPEVLANQLVNAKSEAQIKEITTAIDRAIASQKSVSFFDKMMQWRYLAMLGNPKTHIRNEVGNRVMSGVVSYRNFISRAIQTAVIKDTSKRTRTFKQADATVVLYAREQAKTIIKEMEDTSKHIEAKKQKVFDTKWLEAARKFNYFMLEFRDDVFKQARFEKELSEWMTAKNITVQQAKANPDLVKEGVSYAWEQSLKATFQDMSKLATVMNSLEAKNKLAQLTISTLLPFKKTPINIAKRGFEYSPAGLVKNLTYDIVQLNKGEITLAQYLDKLSEGLSGTTISILGMVLAKLGVLSGGDDDKKLSNFEKAIGEQPYAIRIGDKTYTLDWLTPASIPLFTGVTIYEQMNKETSDDGVFWSTIGAISASFDPMTDMSFLQSFNRILSSYDDNKIEGFIWASLESFTGQFIPTVSNQIARIIDPVRRSTTATGKTGYSKKFDRNTNYLISRIPFLSKQLQPYINVWGEEEANANLLDRLMENTAYPFWINKNQPSSVDNEILRLYNQYGNNEILPSLPNSYYTVNGERVDLTEEEYTKFKIKVGTFSKQQLREIFNSQHYKDLSDENKENIIKKTYSLAREYAKSDLSKEYLVFTALGDSQNKYSRYITEMSLIEGLKDDNGNTIQNSKKNMIATYIQAQKNLSKEQKYLLFALAGYKNTNDKSSVVNYVNALDLSEEQKQLLLQIYNY